VLYRAAAHVLTLVLAVAACSRAAPRRDERADPESTRPASAPHASGQAHAPPPDAASPDVASPDAAPEAVAIVEAPMAWTDERAQLTLAYRRAHSDRTAEDLEIEPRVIVLHYTGGGSAQATRRYFDNVRIEASRAALAKAGAVNVSAHFVIDRDGTIYRLQPETRFARHCIGLNHIAIGIENVGDEARFPLTDAQVAANVALVRALTARFPITHLLGHHEVMQFRDHPYYVELDSSYRNRKGDPGARFMQRVRAELADLALAGL
jgi:N-acetyl-anhydromuramyl-L-alanine amidase AmpD